MSPAVRDLPAALGKRDPFARYRFSWLLARRYLKSSRRDAYVTFLSSLAAVGIAVGVAALILVLAGLSGLQRFLRQDILGRTPHLEVELPADEDGRELIESLGRLDGIVAARRLIRGRAWLVTKLGTSEVDVVGFEGDLPAFFANAEISSGLDDGQGIIVGNRMIESLGLTADQAVDLVSARPTLTPFGPQPQSTRLRVVGSFQTGRTEERRGRVAVSLAVAAKLLGSRFLRVEVETEELESARDRVIEVLAMAPAGSRAQSWEDLNRPLFFALKLEKTVMFVSVFLIVPVAAMALVTALALLISGKREEIGMVRALGASPGMVQRTFVIVGSCLASIGIVLGSVVGIGGSWLFDHFRLISPPGDVYFIDHVPFLIRSTDVLAVWLATTFFCLTSTWLGARRAAELRPIDSIEGR